MQKISIILALLPLLLQSSFGSGTTTTSDSTCTKTMLHGRETMICEDDTAGIISDPLLSGMGEAGSFDMFSPAPKADHKHAEDMGVPQIIDERNPKDTIHKIEMARLYLTNEVANNEKYDKTRDICKNKHENCAFWSSLGECENNPGYMNVNCAPVCQTCEVRKNEKEFLAGSSYPFVSKYKIKINSYYLFFTQHI